MTKFVSVAAFFFLVLTATELPVAVVSKTVSGTFRLSGVNTEYVLTAFAVVADGARVNVTLTADAMYENERFLKLRVYRDSAWPSYLKAQTCSDKIQHAALQRDVSFTRRNEVDLREDNNKNKDKESKSVWTTDQLVILVMNAPTEATETGRPHYWYFVVDDCSLEQYMHDDSVPVIRYELQVFNHLPKNKKNKKIKKNKNNGAAGGEDEEDGGGGGGSRRYKLTHLSADELQLTLLHTVTLISSGLVSALLFLNILLSLARRHATIHVAVVGVAVAAALDAGSSLFELLHLKLYERDGVGSYAADAVSAHLEAAADAVLMLLLLSLGAGWTLPAAGVIAVQTNAAPFTRFCMSMASPVTAAVRCNAAGIAIWIVLAVHGALAQWGRTYNDDFESYHDLEHVPGQLLMIIRTVMGFVMLAATMQTKWKCQVVRLQPFYGKLAVVSFCWFLSLPVLAAVCSRLVPYYLRHPAVFIGSAVMQSGSLCCMAWLVTSHSTVYHRYSRLSASNQEESLTDAAAAAAAAPALSSSGKVGGVGGVGSGAGSGSPQDKANAATTKQQSQPSQQTSIWKMGKAKIRLD